jgi:hypothetical protein
MLHRTSKQSCCRKKRFRGMVESPAGIFAKTYAALNGLKYQQIRIEQIRHVVRLEWQ